MPRVLLGVLLVFLFRAVSFAQGALDVDFGVRGGISSVGPPLEVPNNHYFPDRYSEGAVPPYTLGASLGVRINEHFEVRVEAVRSRFEFSGESGTPFPASGSKSTWTTTGRVWQYPLLVTYHSDFGGLDVFGGGGVSPFISIKGTSTIETTTVVSFSPLETTTTTSTASFRTHTSPLAFHGSAGFSKRLGFISVRPQLRLTFWSFYKSSNVSYQDDSVLFSSVTPEFLIGISFHPLHFSK